MNNEVSRLLNIKTVDIIAELQTKGKNILVNIKKNKKLKISETAGLEDVLSIGKDSRVMLRKNINSEIYGLVNGALGTIIEMNIDNNYVYSLIVKFDKIDKPVIIERFRAEYSPFRNCFITRLQFPLSLAWALTFHKSQGLTLESALIDLGDTVFENGLAYVALSRLKTSKTLLLINFNPGKLKCNKLAIDEYNRLRTKFFPGKLKAINVYNKLPSKYNVYNYQPKIEKDVFSNAAEENEGTSELSPIGILNKSSKKKSTKKILQASKKTNKKILK